MQFIIRHNQMSEKKVDDIQKAVDKMSNLLNKHIETNDDEVNENLLGENVPKSKRLKS